MPTDSPYYGTRTGKVYRPPVKPVANLYNPVANQNKPGTSAAVDYLDANMPQWRNAQGYQQTRMNNALQDSYTGAGGYPQMPAMTPMGPGGGGGGRGGGGGGGGAATGLDQTTLDWLLAQLGQGRPQQLTQNMLDLPDPAQYYGAFNTQPYDVARQGITTGLQGVQDRATTAYDAAQGELGRYVNPYGAGMQQTNPDLYASMAAMANANGAGGQLNQSVGEGAQADRAFGNVQALLGANDQARQAANLRALQGDRTTTQQNLGIEGNMLNLGVNMSQAKGQSAWDQMIKQAGLDAANTEASQNWQRGNTVGDTNVTNRNAWNQGLLATLLQIVGAKAPGTTLPTDWSSYYAAA
jgi:hypothetical protein